MRKKRPSSEGKRRAPDKPAAPMPTPPRFIAPQLLKPATSVPKGPEWIHEIKYDGFRMQARRDQDEVKIRSRGEVNRTQDFQLVADEIMRLPLTNVIFDGEMAAPRANGTTRRKDFSEAIRYNQQDRIFYFVFDLLFLDGRDLQSLPLIERKTLLKDLLQDAPPHIVYVDYLQNMAADEVFRRACNAGAEGVISKRAQSPYRSGRRHESWVKVLCPQ
jgi:bifunctional non-homologous end joining protein LigD